jgi:hypothetical protein
MKGSIKWDSIRLEFVVNINKYLKKLININNYIFNNKFMIYFISYYLRFKAINSNLFFINQNIELIYY